MKKTTRQQALTALKSDLSLIKKQYECINKLIDLDAGQFLNVENDQWYGDKDKVLELYRHVINFAEKLVFRISSKKDFNIEDDIDSQWGNDLVYGSCVFLWGEKTIRRIHHSMFPNLCDLCCYNNENN